MTSIIPFSFDQHAVRTIEQDGQVWFALNDVTDALEFTRGRNAARMLDDDEKGARIVSTPGGDQEITIINESGLYSLILKSRKPSAKRFKKWVTAEVLPAIRKTGTYTAPKPATLSPAHQRHIQNRVTDMANGSRKAFAGLYRSIKDHFGVGSYKDVPEDRYPALCALLMCRPMEGEWLSSEPPQPEQAQALEINYPASWLAANNPHAYQFGYRPNGQDPHIHITAKALYGMDSRSPSMVLLGQLDKAGYDVDACRLEVMAMRHHLEKYGQLCRTLQHSIDIGANNGITFKLSEAAQAMR